MQDKFGFPMRWFSRSMVAVLAVAGVSLSVAPPAAEAVERPGLLATVTTVTSEKNPSVFGEPVLYTARVTVAGAPVTVGKIEMQVGGGSATFSLNQAGVATILVSTVPVGTNTIRALYLGEGLLDPSAGTFEQVVLPATPVTTVPPVTTAPTTSAPTTTVLPSTTQPPTTVPATTAPTPTTAPPVTDGDRTATAVVSSRNPSAVGEEVTFTAHVTTPANASFGFVRQTPSQIAGSTITFTDGSTPLAAVPVAADGTASFTTSALTAGSHEITATFSGTAELASSSGSLTQQVGPPVATTTTVPGVLPATGTSNGSLVIVALGVLAAGFGALALSWRRSTSDRGNRSQ